MTRPDLRFAALVFCGLSAFTCCRHYSVGYGADVYVRDKGFKVVGYLAGGNFKRIDEIELNRLTYLNLAFANPDKEGNLVFDGNFDLTPVVEKAHRAGLKVFVSLAGGGKPDTAIWKSVLLPDNRPAFLKRILGYVGQPRYR